MSDPSEHDDASDADTPPAGEPGPGPSAGPDPDGAPLDGLIVVLHRPRDLVNIALVIRAMKNMGLSRLRVVDPGEWDEHRLEGIAHGTMDLIRSAGHFDTLEAAIADAVRVVGTTARRRTHPREWSTPEEAAPELLARTADGPVALLFGPEDTGLTNEELDVCHELLSIPANPDHPTLNLAHAALLVFHEMRRAARRAGAAEDRDLSPGKDRTAPPSTAGELEEFFGVWREALDTVGFFHGIDPGPKMRSFRSLFRRADPDRRELGLLEAAAYEVIHYARRFRARHGIEGGEGDEPGAGGGEPGPGAE
jgi:TrmH family RNA methyltransferase